MSLTRDIPAPPESGHKPVTFTLNGKEAIVEPDGERSLLSVLREDFNCLSLKNLDKDEVELLDQRWPGGPQRLSSRKGSTSRSMTGAS